MRSFLTPVLACATIIPLGCSVPQRRNQVESADHWAELCHRLRPSNTTAFEAPTPLGPTVSEQTELCKTIKSTSRSVVKIRTAPAPTKLSASDPSSGTRAVSTRTHGTGIVVGSQGLIATSAHVIAGASEVFVTLPDGSQHRAQRVVCHEELDLAVLRIARNNLEPLELAQGASSRGTPVATITGEGPTVRARTGVITNPQASLQNELDPSHKRDYSSLLESTAKLEPGDSGGPLLDGCGRVIGLNVAIVGENDPDRYRAYAIPFDRRTREALGELMLMASSGSVSPRTE